MISTDIEDWVPCYLNIDENDKIFIADCSNASGRFRSGDRVLLLNREFTEIQVLLRRRHQIEMPYRLCYVQERHLLIVGLAKAYVSVFSLCSTLDEKM